MSFLFDTDINSLVSELKLNRRNLDDIYNYVIDQTAAYNRFRFWESFDKDILIEQYSALENGDVITTEPSSLFGMPIGVKDIMNTKTYPTQMGSSIWAGFRAGNDARVVHNVKIKGGIVAGKTVTAEFAVHELNKTLNPWDINRTPGTSSSGSAVAVSLGIVPVALATQTAGSIIRPSSFCGVYGYMPSFGLIPRTGILKTTDSLDTVGFITSNVKNIRLVLDSIRVSGLDYPFAYRALSANKQKSINRKKWKVAFVKTYVWDGAESYVKESILSFVDKLRKDPEIEVVDLDVDGVISNCHKIHELIYDKSLSYYFENEFKDKEHMSEIMKSMIEKGRNIRNEEFLKALSDQEFMCHQSDELFGKFDAAITISTSSIAPYRGERELDDPSLIWTLLHHPAVNVPTFKEETTGMPFGVQFVTRRFNDYDLIDLLEYLSSKEYIPEHIEHPFQ